VRLAATCNPSSLGVPLAWQYQDVRTNAKQEAEEQEWAVAGLLREAAATFGRRTGICAASDFFTFHVPLRAAAGREAGAPAVEDDDAGPQSAGPPQQGALRPRARSAAGSGARGTAR
jgi:ribonuclease Z